MGKKKNVLNYLALLSQLGITMIVPILGCMLVGGWADEKFQSAPWGLVVMTLLGVGAAFRNLFTIILKETKKGEKDE